MNKQKGLAPILIVILIALAVGGYLLYQKQIKSNPPLPTAQLTSAPTSTQTPTPESTNSADITNWKTYTNEKYKFSLKYPPSAVIDGYSYSKAVLFISFHKDRETILLSVDTLSTKTNLRDWINEFVIQRQSDNKVYTIVRGNIDPYEKYSLQGFSFKGVGPGGGKLDKYIIFQKDKLIFLFDLGGETGGEFSQEGEFLLDQILSTFEFTQ